MNLQYLCLATGITLAASLAAWCYIVYEDLLTKEAAGKVTLQALLSSTWKIKLYAAVMFISSLALAIGLRSIYVNSPGRQLLQSLLLVMLLFPIAWKDMKSKKIPNEFLLLGIFLRFVFYAAELLIDAGHLLTMIRSDLIACFIFMVIILILQLIPPLRKGIGMGDIKLILLLCLFQGLDYVVSSIFLSLVVIWFIAVGLLVFKKKSRKDFIPFAPAILVGTYLSIFMLGA